jgi:hypothetical protein
MKLPPNDSPLAKLFAGYRSGYAGLNCLVPGDATGAGMNGATIRDYVERFYAGEEDYQTDKKWYELVCLAEKAKRGGSKGGIDAGGEPPIEGQTPEVTVNVGQTKNGKESSETIIKEPEYERDNYLSKTYELVFDQAPITINVNVMRVLNQTGGDPFYVRATSYNFEYFYEPNNSIFEESMVTPLDYFLIDLSQHFLVLSAQSPRDWPVSKIERLLRKAYFPETLNEISEMSDMASALIIELREFIDGELPEMAPISLDVIDDENRRKIERQVLQIDLGNKDFVDETIKSGKFVKYIDSKFLPKIISRWPNLVMDGKFFSNPYENLSIELKGEAILMLLNGLDDVLWLSGEGRDALSKDMAWRLRFGKALASLKLIQSWRSN